MALLNATTLAGFVLLFYLSSFVVFAVLRIATGVSIQRVGYFSLRHIAYTPKEGLRVEIRGLGLSLHRPNFAQPTWLSLRLTELKVIVDPGVLQKSPKTAHGDAGSGSSGSDAEAAQKEDLTAMRKHQGSFEKKEERSQLWKKLTNAKERIKRVHRKINWLRMLDLMAVNTTLEVIGAGHVQIASFTMAVDTRRKMVDRGRLFRHKKDPLGDQRPAEWIFTVKSVFLTVGASEPVEVLDNASVNIHGILYRDREGLRDTSIAIRGGRLHIPYDDIHHFSKQINAHSAPAQASSDDKPQEEITFTDVVEELDRPGSREASIVQTVSDSKEFISSILQSVQEIQWAMTFVRFSKVVDSSQALSPLVLNVVTHEIGIDLHRLDSGSPAHRMYFSRDDVAHQALVAAISISVSLDDNDNSPNKIMYIPMATTTIRTTVPSKTMSFTEERDVSERNSNVLFANLVVTSPSVDLEPRHLVQLLALQQKPKTTKTQSNDNHRLISRLLPRASIKFSIHEPVVRFVLPVAHPTHSRADDYDMIISAISSISLEVESSHSSGGDLRYSLASNFRISSHQLYYQAASGMKHNLVVTDSLEIKVQLSATTEVQVVLSGTLRSFSVLMVREEVSTGVYNIVRHFKRNVKPDKLQAPLDGKPTSFLRRLPSWLLECHLEGSDCSVEIGGMDKPISKQTRGLALQLESWTADYYSQKVDHERRPSSSRRRPSLPRTDEIAANVKNVPHARKHLHPQDPTDGRRLTAHVRGLEGFIIEALDSWEHEPFLSLPRFEVALSTSRDLQGAIFHVNSAVRAFYLEFSLYRYYSIGVGVSILKDAFMGPAKDNPPSPPASLAQKQSDGVVGDDHHQEKPISGAELVTIDVKVALMQIKANMPADPPLLLQIFEVAAGRHRWSAPFLRSHLLRLHAEAPRLHRVWARLVSINNIRVDIRQSKRKTTHGLITERSLDLSTDFIRLAVPHGLTMYKVFDNFINTAKSVAQLHHRFKTRSNEYILTKVPEGPKQVPRISLRSKALMFELEDDPFEWKLNTIYHIGLIEQKQRLARAEAFSVKLRRLEGDRYRRSPSRPQYRTRSGGRLGRTEGSSQENARSRSHDDDRRARSTSRGRTGKPSTKLRYNPDGVCSLSGSTKVQGQEAWQKLQEHNARSWKKRIDGVLALQNNVVKNIRRMFSGADEPPHDVGEEETILAIPNRPGLMATVISDLHLVIDKPSFPISQYPRFIHEIGKGMPYDMQYGLLIPLNISLDMGEARVMLRDYPLNLLHIPAIRSGQPPRLPSWSLKTDFIIAEEFRDDRSTRDIKVDIVGKGQRGPDGEEIPGFSLDVKRTVSPVKTYSKPIIDINTSLPTTISWGTSYQPVIQDMMMTIEGFTKPEIDPSDRVGFWDKIRMSFHSRLIVNWKGDGDVQLRLKGSRDPYVVTGYGAGFVMCWRNDVQWAIHTSDDPKKFMTVTSGEYVLAIPDYSHQARDLPEHHQQHDTDSVSSGGSQKGGAIFKKVIMKLSGNVQWLAGLVFERDLKTGGRSSNFEPLFNVVLKNPRHMEKSQLQNYDAFRGFRSDHIHLSIAVAAPFDRDWTSDSTKPANGYNSVHLSPRFFTHFFNWWSLFSGVMSLPIRQGNLWSGPGKTSKKFGRHLATIKYNLLFSPLFLAHVYKHKDAEDYIDDVVSATGLKIRLDSFVLDLHQRREYFDTQAKGKSKQTRTSGMRINQAELDFVSADVRAVSANIGGTTADDLLNASDEVLSSYQDPTPEVDMSQFTIPDHDMSWIDMDDFVELDWILPAESNPETKILPLAFTPRFTYFRQTDHGDSVNGDKSRISPFGDEATHSCVMSHHNDPRKVQMQLVRSRLESIGEQMDTQGRLMGEQELRVVRDGDQDQTLKDAHDNMVAQQAELQHKRRFLERGLQLLAGPISDDELFRDRPQHRDSTTTPDNEGDNDSSSSHIDMEGLFGSPLEEFSSDFNNRFIVHNVQLKWNNALRNIILRYSHQVSQRRGFIYYMSRRAVKFILDIVDEQAKSKTASTHTHSNTPLRSPVSNIGSPSDEKDEDSVVEDRIAQLLGDANRFVNADDPTASDAQSQGHKPLDAVSDGVAEDFVPLNSYHVRLIAPQIQLQSEKDTQSVVLISAKGMEFKVISIMDRGNLSDDVSGLVQRRFALDMDGAQFFVTNRKRLAKFLHLYSGNRYGNGPGTSWPPWVSLEVMFDFRINPFGFQRIIQKTSASLRYEKYNPLRLKYNEKVASGENDAAQPSDEQESRMDQLWIDFPQIRASCDSAQYYAMYIIVMDLLLYSEPLEKTRSERLEKIMLASDFSDLRGAPEIATSLQERIHQLEEIKNHFQINAKYLDRDGWQDRIKLEKDLSTCENELFFIMKAITTSQQKNDDRKTSQAAGLHRWYLSASEIVWHLMRDKNEPLVEFQLGNAAYERIDNRDGSNRNAMEIQRLRGLNLLPNALYPDMIGPYQDSAQTNAMDEMDHKMIQVQWYMLEAIAGIPVLEEFLVKMFPLQVQLEQNLGKQLFEYIFPGAGSGASESSGFSPMMVKNMKPIEDDDDSEVEEASNALSPNLSNGSVSSEELLSRNIGALGRRLKPTLNLQHNERLPASTSSTSLKHKGLGISGDHRLGLFRHPSANSSRATIDQVANRKPSLDSLQMTRRNGDSGQHHPEDKKRFGLRSSSKDGRSKGKKNKKDKKDKPSDDLSMMMDRASNYMTLAHVKLESFVICLSYKGKGDRNIEDLHDFVFRMPTLEYRNKTWSNLDLALRLKKDVIKALISHTGAILGNKFTHHRANKQQQNRLREIAASSAIIPNSETLVNTPATSETASLYSASGGGERSYSPPRKSFTSTNGRSALVRSESFASSIHSVTPSTFREAGVPPPGEPIGTIRPSVSASIHLMFEPLTDIK